MESAMAGLGMPAPVPMAPQRAPEELNQLHFNNNSEHIPAPALGAEAVNQYMQQTLQQPPMPVKVVRRNLTVAEILTLFVAAIITVSLGQTLLNSIPVPSVRIEFKR